MDFFEYTFGGSHNFRAKGNKKSKVIAHIYTNSSNWAIQNKNNDYYILWHNPTYKPREQLHIQLRSKNMIWVLWVAYTHDFYKENKLPYQQERKGNEDFLRFIKDFKRYLTFNHLAFEESDFD